MALKDEWALVRKRAKISRLPDLILRGMKLWADEIKVDYSLENEELARREKAGVWMNQDWRFIKGICPYTEQQLRDYLSIVRG